MTELREKYDFIVIDTSPIGLVPDAYAIIEQSDLCLFVIRCMETNKSFCKHHSYGSGYGYGYGGYGGYGYGYLGYGGYGGYGYLGYGNGYKTKQYGKLYGKIYGRFLRDDDTSDSDQYCHQEENNEEPKEKNA